LLFDKEILETIPVAMINCCAALVLAGRLGLVAEAKRESTARGVAAGRRLKLRACPLGCLCDGVNVGRRQ